jgi:ribosomal protein L5
MFNSSQRSNHVFVVNFFLINKFTCSNVYKFPSIKKVILNTFVQDLEISVSVYYPRSLLLLENLSFRKPIIKNIKKTLKGKKSYQICVSHLITLRKNFSFNFFNFFLYFFTRGMDEKFIKYNLFMSKQGNYYVRVKDVSSLPGMSEQFFKWPYLLDCFFIVNKLPSHSFHILKYFLKYNGFYLLN